MDAKRVELYVQQARALAQTMNARGAAWEEKLHRFLAAQATPLDRRPARAWSAINRRAYIHLPIAQALLDGLHRQGMETHLECFDTGLTTKYRLMGSLIEHAPELFVFINAAPSAALVDLGFTPETVRDMQRPRVTYRVDELAWVEEEDEAAPGEYDYFFCMDRLHLQRLEGKTTRAFHLPAATILNQPGTVREAFRHPLVYVGSLPAVHTYLQAMPAGLVERFETLEERCRTQYALTIAQHVEESEWDDRTKRLTVDAAQAFCRVTEKDLPSEKNRLLFFAYNVITYLKRKRIVLVLLPGGLHLYGPESWLDILPDAYRDRYHGPAAREDLADLYVSAQMSLNIHSHQCPTSLNNRDFDIPMAGGVVLGDWVEDADRGLLAPGEEMVVFRTPQEAMALAPSYLAQPERLAALRERGSRAVREKHTFTQRAEAIVSALGWDKK